MPELTRGVALSDLVARVVVVNDGGQVLPQAGDPAPSPA